MRYFFILVVVITVVAVALVLQRRSRGRGSFGFREVVKDRALQEELTEQMNPQELEKLTDAEVRDLVDAYVKTQGQSAEYWKVGAIRVRAAPYLIEVVRRPEAFVRPAQDRTLSYSPAERALEMLRECPDSLIPVLVRVAESSEPSQRRVAAFHLASTGQDDLKDVVIRLLSDSDEYVRARAVGGLARAVEANRAQQGIRSEAMAPLKAITAQTRSEPSSKEAIGLMLHLDRAAAIEHLTSDAVINATNLNAASILERLTEEAIPVPSARLLQLIEPISATDRPIASHTFGQALQNLALQKHPSAEQLIQKTLAEPAQPGENALPSYQRTRLTRRGLAAEALCILNGLPNPVKTAFANEEKGGFDSLPLPQKQIVLICHLDGEVCNGGFSQYFFNSNDDPNQVIAALEAIEAQECVRIFRQAVSVFGRSGPGLDTETRRARLEKLSKSQDKILGEADEKWFQENGDLGTLLHLYALKHQQDFRPEP